MPSKTEVKLRKKVHHTMIIVFPFFTKDSCSTMRKNSDEKAIDDSEHKEEQLFDVEEGIGDANPFEADNKDKKGSHEIPQKKDGSADEIIELEEVSAKAPAIRKNCVATPYDDKPVSPRKNSVVAKASAISERKKLEMLKKKVSEAKKRQSNSKKRSQRQKKVKQVQGSQKEVVAKKESKVVKKTIGERLREKFNAVTNFFTLGKQAQKAQRRAQAKLLSTTIKNVAEGDDTMPIAGSKPVQHASDVWDEDVWIEDPTVLTDRRHRSDLAIVLNKDNGGELWHEGKRPFWKDKALQKEVPPAPSEKPVSKLLIDVVSSKTPLAEPAPEPSCDELAPIDDLKRKDPKWFQEEQVLSNTIRSIVCSMNESMRPPMITGGPARKLAIIEPTITTVYYRHNNNNRETIPFTKSPIGKATKLRSKTKGPKGISSSISSNSAKEKKAKK